MTVIGVAMLGKHPDHEVVTIGGCHTHLNTKHLLLVRLALEEAFHFRRMQAVQFVFVLLSLSQQQFGQGQPGVTGVEFFAALFQDHSLHVFTCQLSFRDR